MADSTFLSGRLPPVYRGLGLRLGPGWVRPGPIGGGSTEQVYAGRARIPRDKCPASFHDHNERGVRETPVASHQPHLKGNSHRHNRHDKTVAPACRPPPRRRPGRQLRLAARPPTRSDIVRHAKCKLADVLLRMTRPKLLH